MKTYTTAELAMYYGKTVKCERKEHNLHGNTFDWISTECEIGLYFLKCEQEGLIRNVDLTGLKPNKFNEDEY